VEQNFEIKFCKTYPIIILEILNWKKPFSPSSWLDSTAVSSVKRLATFVLFFLFFFFSAQNLFDNYLGNLGNYFFSATFWQNNTIFIWDFSYIFTLKTLQQEHYYLSYIMAKVFDQTSERPDISLRVSPPN
jgi:hypothetical protein